MLQEQWVFAATMEALRERNCLTVQVGGQTLVLFLYGEQVYAVDNRCPHMGFPLDRGTVKDGILTCHWHHARFDLASGGTFDQFADDVPSFPVEIRDGELWVDVQPRHDGIEHQRQRLRDGLEQTLSLVIAKAVIFLLHRTGEAREPFRIGLEFGTQYRRNGWGQGLTILSCMMNLLPYLEEGDQARALYHGLSAVANDTAGNPPRFPIQALPNPPDDLPLLKRWFRQFIEVRDDEGAERVLASAVQLGATDQQLADMLFAAVTDHRYLQVGHVLDFTNKAFEALDIAGWEPERSAMVLSSLIRMYVTGTRMEETNAWRYPVDLVLLLDEAFALLPELLRGQAPLSDAQRNALVDLLLGDDPAATVSALLDALREGLGIVPLAGAVTYAAALRIARFHTSNEFGDWDTALHTFTFANAVQKGLERSPSPELARGVFDAAMSIYLDRFLNIPPARLPNPNGSTPTLDSLTTLLNQQQQVNPAGQLVADYLYHEGDADALLAHLGHLLLREDRDFHTIQMIEAAFEQFRVLRGTPEGLHVLVAAARYLAAHAPTVRSQEQTFSIAQRLYRGEKLFAES